MIISHKTSGVPFVCYIGSLIIYPYYQIHPILQYTFIIIILHVSTVQSINTPSLLILTIKHNITMYWLPIELGVILSIMCTMFSVCILMSWQNFTQKCISASKVKDDLRCSFEKQIKLQLIPSLSTNIDHACWSLLTKWFLWFIHNFIIMKQLIAFFLFWSTYWS